MPSPGNTSSPSFGGGGAVHGGSKPGSPTSMGFAAASGTVAAATSTTGSGFAGAPAPPHAAAATSTFQRGVPAPAPAPPPPPANGNVLRTQQQHEVIELDSDTDSSQAAAPAPAPKNRKIAPAPPGSSRNGAHHLQPPFDPIPRNGQQRASASPSIASLIHHDSVPHIDAPKPTSKRPSPTSAHFPDAVTGQNTTAAPHGPPAKKHKKGDNGESTRNSPKSKDRAPSPKVAGTGLLGGSLVGMPAAGPDVAVPNIRLHVPLNGEVNTYINFQRIAEDKYGWEALNPRLAEARRRMQMDSGDDMAMDDSDSESNQDKAGGVSTGPPTEPKKQTRKPRDGYDRNDPFIDDSETLWEEQAAASKDGFFVYSGPLVKEGEKPTIERADGTIKRGRGRGRGRGTASTRGGGPGAPRKPRITKKEKEKMEQEKAQREKMSQAMLAHQAAQTAKAAGGGMTVFHQQS